MKLVRSAYHALSFVQVSDNARLRGHSLARSMELAAWSRLSHAPKDSDDMVVSVAALVTSENMVGQYGCNISSLTLLGSAAAFGSAGYIVDINSDTYEA